MIATGEQPIRPRQSRRFLHREQGFTGIELLIVLATLGVLVGIVAMSLDDMDQCARNREIRLEMSALQAAIEMYNSHDVEARGATSIPPQTTPVMVSVADPMAAPFFQRYLPQSTKFKYIWQVGGAQLQIAE